MVGFIDSIVNSPNHTPKLQNFFQVQHYEKMFV
jgi:hypothetical protein